MPENTAVTETENPTTENTETETENTVNGDTVITEHGESVPAVSNPESETETAPKFKMPNNSTEFALEIPEGHDPNNRRDPVVKGIQFMEDLAIDILDAVSEITAINTVLAKQTDMFKPENLLAMAQTDTEPEIVKAYAAYEKLLARVEESKQKLMEAVTAKIGDEKLSDEDIAAKEAERKTLLDTVKVQRETIGIYVDKKLSGENVEFMKFFVENLKVPGMRATSGTSTSGTTSGDGSFKPRLNGGKVTVTHKGNVNQFPNFVSAAKHISGITGRVIGANDLGQLWLDKNNVGAWQDCPEMSDFNFNEEIAVHVHKIPK